MSMIKMSLLILLVVSKQAFSVFTCGALLADENYNQNIILIGDRHLFKLDKPYGTLQRNALMKWVSGGTTSLIIEDSSDLYVFGSEERYKDFLKISPLAGLAQECRNNNIVYNNVEFRTPILEGDSSLKEQTVILKKELQELKQLCVNFSYKASTFNNSIKQEMVKAEAFFDALNSLEDWGYAEFEQKQMVIKKLQKSAAFKNVFDQIDAAKIETSQEFVHVFFDSCLKIAMADLIDAKIIARILNDKDQKKIIVVVGCYHFDKIITILKKHGFSLNGFNGVMVDENRFDPNLIGFEEVKKQFPAVEIGWFDNQSYYYVPLELNDFFSSIECGGHRGALS